MPLKVDKGSCQVNTWPSQANARTSQSSDVIYQANAGISGANTGLF